MKIEPERRDVCAWHQEDWDSDAWNTSCGNCFCLNDGPPSENDMNFCCYCGGKLTEEPWKDDQEEPEEEEPQDAWSRIDDEALDDPRHGQAKEINRKFER